MSEKRLLLDPTDERSPATRTRLPRPAALEGLTVGLLDISKARGNVFLDRIATKLGERGATVARFSKPTFARLAPLDLRQKITTQCHVVIEALAD